MDQFQILQSTGDFFSLRSSRFEGDGAACIRARRLFMATPGILSFEVTPCSGNVAIGFDRKIMRDTAANHEAMALLQNYLPGLVGSNSFKQRYRPTTEAAAQVARYSLQ